MLRSKFCFTKSVGVSILACLYYFTAQLGLRLAIPPGVATCVWPPSGIALAALILFGYRLWPGIWLASFLVNFPNLFRQESFSQMSASILVLCAIATGSTLQALAGAFLNNKFIRSTNPFTRLARVFSFAIIIMVTCMIAPTFGVTGLKLAEYVPTNQYGTNWRTWWLGDLIGMVAVAPAILSFCQPSLNFWRIFTPHKAAGAALSFLFFTTTTALIFSGQFRLFYPYFLFPLIAWCAFSYGQRGVSLFVLIMAGIALWYARLGQGPFTSGNSIPEALLISQGFVGAVALTGLALAAAIYEKSVAHEELQTALEEKGRNEERLKNLSEELDRSNKELEQFSSIASHDLQAPLREMMMFTQLIEQKLSKFADLEENKYFQYVQKAGIRTQQLIESLLEYSKVSKGNKALENVNLKELLEELVEELDAHIKEKKAIIRIGDLPDVQADRVQMRQLFQNLITNSLKYSKAEEPPSIALGSRIQNDFFELYIQDNGVGFDEAHQEIIFKPFHRLDSKVEGSGMGLAICKKIVERYGGQITAKSRPQKGSKFIIKFPAEMMARVGRVPRYEKTGNQILAQSNIM